MSTHFDEMLADYLVKLEREQRERYYRQGLAAAAHKVIGWAEMGAGGAGIVDERSKNLAEAIRNIDPTTGS